MQNTILHNCKILVIYSFIILISCFPPCLRSHQSRKKTTSRQQESKQPACVFADIYSVWVTAMNFIWHTKLPEARRADGKAVLHTGTSQGIIRFYTGTTDLRQVLFFLSPALSWSADAPRITHLVDNIPVGFAELGSLFLRHLSI